MLLLDREIHKKTKSDINAKVRLTFQEDILDKHLCRLVGNYLGTTTTRATIDKAFVFLAGIYTEPNCIFFEHFSYDEGSKLLQYLEDSSDVTQANTERDPENSTLPIDVRVLKWNLLVLSSKILKVTPDIKSTEDIVNSVLKLALERFEMLFGGEELLHNG